MHDQNMLMKWILVAFTVVVAAVAVWPPDERLKYGIDLQGGTSLLFEIDTVGLTENEQRDLSTRVMNILKERVDPTGSLNLIWRPVGNTRLEIQMPQPSEKSKRRREVKNSALEAIKALNVQSRRVVEQALNKSGDEREAVLAELVRGIPGRQKALEELRDAHDAMTANPEDGSLSKAYEEAMEAIMATDLNLAHFNDILQLGPGKGRDHELTKIRGAHPAFVEKIDAYVETYDEWAKDKAGLEDPSDLKRLLKGAGVLEFRILADRDMGSPAHIKSSDPSLRQPIADYVDALHTRGPRARAADRYRWFPIKDIVDFMNLEGPNLAAFDTTKDSRPQIVEKYAGRYYGLAHNDPDYGLLRPREGSGRAWKLTQARPDRDYQTGQNCVSFTLDPVGGESFGELTGRNLKRQLCIVLDGEMMSHATIQSRIGQRGQITGGFTHEDVMDLVRILEAGALPGRLKETPLMEKTIGPSIGKDNRQKGLVAVRNGFILVVVFMVFYYGLTSGLIADMALVMNLLLVLGIMALMQSTFTLPGIAGLILTVGMAIDANVLIFERIREERDRGVPLKKAVNNGYDKALSTIVDANLTTLIICVILGYVGSEEVKGFAIILGIGISTSMFTALFVTRLVFNSLMAKGWLKDLSMRRLIRKPSIDWMSLRTSFWPISLVLVVGGLALFLGVSTSDPESMFDIEFLGGTSVQVDFKEGVRLGDGEEITTEAVREVVNSTKPGVNSAANWLAGAADALDSADVAAGEGAGQYTLTSDTLNGDQLATLVRGKIEDKCDSVRAEGHTAVFNVKTGELSTVDVFRAVVADAAAHHREKTWANLRAAKVQSVGEGETAEGQSQDVSYEIVTVETDRSVVQEAIVAVLGDKLKVEPSISFVPTVDHAFTQEPFFVVREEARYLSDAIGGDANYDIRRFKGGVAVVVDELDPPLTEAAFEKRLREMSLRPEAQDIDISETGVFQLSDPGEGGTYTRFAVLMVSDSLPFTDEDEDRWTEFVAAPALDQVKASLGISKSLRKVVQFAPQVAGQAKQDAVVSIILALASIVAYVWIRFGTMQFGLASIVALVHDVAIALGAVTITDYLAETTIGSTLGVLPLKIDLPMIAALMTIIGYSLNDTIVVFDRIRENRGKATTLTANLVNQSLNETLSRTVLTSITTLLVVLVLYVIGGAGIRGFSFVLLIGIVVGTYSSLAIATPLLYRPQLLNHVVRVIVAFGAIGVVFIFIDSINVRLVMSVIILAGLVYAMVRAGGQVRQPGRPAVAT